MPVKSKAKGRKKQSKAKKSSQKKAATKKTTRKTLKRQSRIRTKRARQPAAKKTRKTPSKKTTTTNKKKKTAKKKRAANTTHKSKSTQTKEERRFAMLLKELRDMRDHNRELAQELEEVKTTQVQQPRYSAAQQPQEEMIQRPLQEPQQETQASAQKPSSQPTHQEQTTPPQKQDRLLSRIKDLISTSQKKTDTPLTQQTPADDKEQKAQEQNASDKQRKSPATSPDEQVTLDKKEESVQLFSGPLQKTEKPIELPKPTSLTERESFQTNRSRGIISMEEAEEYSALLKQMLFEVNKVFIGQEEVVEKVIISLMCDAHTLLEGVPGLAKSLLVEVLRRTVDGTTFERIQFLPDLLPSDIIGGQIFNPKTSQFVTHKGPIFANFILADEINRAPPKTHAAIMEAMQEKKINIENDEYILDRPFLVLATQNPLENKGTYELPEAVLDRFMFKVMLDYPKREDEMHIITENATTKKNLNRKVKAVMDKEKLLEIQKRIKQVFISEKIREYILDLVSVTRGSKTIIEGVKFLKYGAGVRASIYLGIAAKAKALVEGRNYVLPDDVAYVLPDVFRHRLKLNYRGKAHNISVNKIIEEILKKVNAV